VNWLNSSSVLFKNKIIFDFEKFMATQKGKTNNLFLPSSCFQIRDPRSKMGDPGSGMKKNNQDLGSGINIPDLQHCTVFNH
jgi:hypothetical protein